jgi:hypothetical protein
MCLAFLAWTHDEAHHPIMKAALPCPLALCLVALITGIPVGLGACHALDDLDESEPLPEKRDGEIPERLFAFTQVTTSDDEDGGGWWAGCLHLQLDRGPDADKSSQVMCDWEYGFPVVTKQQGRVSLPKAQEVAADATNQAVAKVPRRGRMTVEICTDLHDEILRMADNAIKGSRLDKTCGATHGPVPEFKWP